MSAFGGKADIEISGRDVCFDPKRTWGGAFPGGCLSRYDALS